ncbi:hypothetical protein OBO34_07235 [Clostridiales Family XIII bacterium ASD5510]|uniref:Uncharacterized protein n=1 Tax=Hominibacterium faecale TaxID=2839743 RepID=A0A9J6QQ66_9FIRM|nr:hypothetical protein [Hominibacterium faecale]MCU7378146.1 hypothetical protein [Hominibacterium faecale]
MEMAKCERCGKENSVFKGWEYRVLGNRLCWSCRREKEREDEKRTILTEKDYKPFNTDDGYYCPYCGEFIEISDDYDMYDDGEHETV